MALLAGAVWTVVDDDGTGGTGTEFDAAFIAAIKASIEDEIVSATNPTEVVADIIDEVVEARGVEASLDDRLDGIDTALAGVVTADVVQEALANVNLVQNELFHIWHAGDTAAPAYWSLNGVGATIARAGSGLADTNTIISEFCAKVTRVAATTVLDQDLIGPDFALIQSAFAGLSIGLGAWVRSTSIGGARIYVDDGVNRTYSTANAAANAWEWLSCEQLIDAAATGLTIGISNDVDASSCYLSAATFMFTPVGAAPSRWMPSPTVYSNHYFFISGAVTVGTNKFIWAPHRPGLIRNVMLFIGTAPTGADLKVDVNTWDGAAYTTAFTTKPSITAASSMSPTNLPDGTYARRCLYRGGTTAGGAMSIDVDQVGSGVAGSNLGIMVQVLHPARLLEAILAPAYVG